MKSLEYLLIFLLNNNFNIFILEKVIYLYRKSEFSGI